MSQGFARDESGTSGRRALSTETGNVLKDNGFATYDIQDKDELPARKGDSQEELDLRHRLRVELSQDVSKSERLEAIASLNHQIQSCSVETKELLWEIVGDMTTPDADLESRKAAFSILQASAVHLDLPSHRTKLFNLITTPVNHSVVNCQLSALTRLIGLGAQVSGLETKLAGFLIQLMRGLFPSAEQARQNRYKGGDTDLISRDNVSRQRPEEERALLSCLSLIARLIENGTEVFIGADLEAMLSCVSTSAAKTTGSALMRHFFQIISAVTLHTQIPIINLEDCVRLLCHIMIDMRYEFRSDAWAALFRILNSDLWQESLEVLFGRILADSNQSDKLKCSILDMLARSSAHLKAELIRLDIFARQLRSACQSLREQNNSPPEFVDPLVQLAMAYGPSVNLETFEVLLGTTKEISEQSGLDQSTERSLLVIVSQALIQLFLNCLLHSGPKSALLYDMLLSLAAWPKPASVRLAVVKLLARLRCDADCGIKVLEMPDTHGLAATLCRTKASIANVRASASPSSHTSSSGQSQPSRKVRSRISDFGGKTRSRSRSGSRVSNIKDRFPSAVEPLWVYDESRKGLPIDPPQITSTTVYAQGPKTKETGKSLLNLGEWLEIMINELEKGSEWELYSYVLVHLPSQLSNCSLFEDHARQISDLHELLNTQLTGNSFPEPPPKSGIRRGDIALCLYNSLTMLLAYQGCIGVRQWNRTVSTFRLGIEKWDRVGKFCIHALALCCYEIPNIIEKHTTVIIEMMQKRITQSDLAMDILEFLGGLAHLPEAYNREDIALHQKIFGICIRYLQHARGQRKEHENENNAMVNPVSNRNSASSGDAFRSLKQPQMDQTQRNLAEYVFTIAYQVIIYWFLAIDLRERSRHVGWITQELAFTTENGKEEMDEQSLVLLDMMHRTTFSDLGETFSAPQFSDPKRKVYKGSWLVGMSAITAEIVMDESSGRAECGQFTKRQASGTTHAVYYHNTVETPIHHVSEHSNVMLDAIEEQFNLYPNHMVLQLISTISPEPAPLQPIPLPEDDDFTSRALRQFDNTDTVDGHKAAVIYIGDGQTSEKEILANSAGSGAYSTLLSQLGTKVPLKDAKFNAQGLDRQFDTDGSHTYAWRNRVAEIVFHVPTMMPNDSENDASCTKKKAHIGNDHVKIMFNESGLPFEFDTFASEFNSVNIVITPEAHTRGKGLVRDRRPQSLGSRTESGSRTPTREASATERFGYFLVQEFVSDKYPDFSPVASPKIISACALGGFVRQLALDASLFCQVWQYKSLGEYTSSWRFRLQQLMRLREKYANANASANVDYPQAALGRPLSYVESGSWTGNMIYGGMAEKEKMIASLDFTRWTR